MGKMRVHHTQLASRIMFIGWIALMVGSLFSSVTVARFPVSTTFVSSLSTTTVSGPRLSTTTVTGPALSTTTVSGSGTSGSSSVSGSVIATTCSLYNTAHQVIFVIGLIMIIIGAALYAGSHVLPGNLKSNAQGYGMGMVVGGVVGVILALSAPFILGVVTGNFAIAAQCGAYPAF